MKRRYRTYGYPNLHATGMQEKPSNGYPSNYQQGMTCKVRALNAAAGFGEFKVMIGDIVLSESLPFGEVSEYKEVIDGFAAVTVTMVQNPQAVLLTKIVPFRKNDVLTMAIINSAGGIDLQLVSEVGCENAANDMACFRVANFSYTSPPVDIMLESGEEVFTDVRFKEVTVYKQAIPGEYNFNVVLTEEKEQPNPNDLGVIEGEPSVEEGEVPEVSKETLAYFYEEFEPGKSYTAYIIGNTGFEPTLMVVTLV